MAEILRTPQRLTAAEKRAEVVRLRRSRASFEEIGQALGVSRQRAHKIYSQAVAEIPKAQVEAHLAEELALIDEGIADLLKLAHDHRRPRSAIDAWNGIARFIELEARLLDIFPAAKSRVQVITQEMVDAEIDRMAAELLAAGAMTEAELKAWGWSGSRVPARRMLPGKAEDVSWEPVPREPNRAELDDGLT